MDTLSSEKRSWNMSRIRGRDTVPELKVRSTLHRLGYRFRLHVSGLPGRPDVVLPKYKTIVFVHGCFWHRHPGCKYAYSPKSRVKFWSEKFEETVLRDQRKAGELRALGWTVITVWECETKKLDELERRVVSELASVN